MKQVALDMLLARYDEFKLDSIYLGQLCNEAIALKKFKQAVDWSISRTRLAKTSGEVDSALPQAILIINAAKATESVIQDLQAKENRNAVETCLLVEMLERSSSGEQAESILQISFAASKAAKETQDIQILARQRVRLAQGRRDWGSAAKAARELLDLPGGRKSSNVQQLIELYLRTSDDKSALQWIAEWKRLSPGSLAPWLIESRLLEQSGKTNESITVLRRASQKFPKDPELLAKLAQKYLRYDQPENAQRIFWRQYETSEKLADKLRWADQLARVANEEGEIFELVERFEERRKNNPQSIEPLLSIAQAHRIAGNYEDRRTALMKATLLKEDDLALSLELARLEESEGDWDKAIQTLERASVLDKTNQAKQKIAQLYLKYGETKKGLAQLLAIAGGADSTAKDIEKIAEPLMKNATWEELLDFLAPSLARFPNNFRLGYMAAIANEELGNTEVAKGQFLKLLRTDQEISTGNVAQGNQLQGYLKMFERSLPQKSIELLRMTVLTRTLAYSYRQEAAQVRRSSMPTRLKLPDDLESCYSFSLCHLYEIAGDLPSNERDELQRQLQRMGVENVKLLMADLFQEHILQNPLPWLEIDPDNKALLALAALATQDDDPELPPAVCLNGFKAYKDSFPTIGLIYALKLDQTQSENQARLAEVVERLKKIKEPDSLLIYYVAGRTSRFGKADEQDPLSKHRAVITNLLSDWYSKMPRNSGYVGLGF